MASWKAGGDGRSISFSGANWTWRKGYCPATGEPCPCREGGMSKAFCRDYASQNERDRP